MEISTHHISNTMPRSSQSIVVFQTRAALDPSVMSEDISAAWAGFNCHQQIVLFVNVGIDGRRGHRRKRKMLLGCQDVVLLRHTNCQGRYQENTLVLTSYKPRLILKYLRPNTPYISLSHFEGTAWGRVSTYPASWSIHLHRPLGLRRRWHWNNNVQASLSSLWHLVTTVHNSVTT